MRHFRFRSATAIFVALATSLTLSSIAAAHDYTGETKCEDCHDKTHEALHTIKGPKGEATDPITVWQNDPHRQAFDKLTSSWGQQAAQTVHVADPQAEGSMCLKCHATGTGGSSPPDPSEGVSCEACHGAAADWAPRAKHGEINDDPAKLQTALALGLVDLRKMDVREQTCRGCHVSDPKQERPCYRPTEKPFDVHRAEIFRHWRDNVPAI